MNETKAVIIEDPNLTAFDYAILYQPGEAEQFKTIFCGKEVIADRYIHEYEHTGTLTILSVYEGGELKIEPVTVIKVKLTRALRKEFRLVGSGEDGA